MEKPKVNIHGNPHKSGVTPGKPVRIPVDVSGVNRKWNQ